MSRNPLSGVYLSVQFTGEQLNAWAPCDPDQDSKVLNWTGIPFHITSQTANGPMSSGRLSRRDEREDRGHVESFAATATPTGSPKTRLQPRTFSYNLSLPLRALGADWSASGSNLGFRAS